MIITGTRNTQNTGRGARQPGHGGRSVSNLRTGEVYRTPSVWTGVPETAGTEALDSHHKIRSQSKPGHTFLGTAEYTYAYRTEIQVSQNSDCPYYIERTLIFSLGSINFNANSNPQNLFHGFRLLKTISQRNYFK